MSRLRWLLIFALGCSPRVIQYPPTGMAAAPAAGPSTGPSTEPPVQPPAPEPQAAQSPEAAPPAEVAAVAKAQRESRRERRARRRAESAGDAVAEAARHYLGDKSLRCDGEAYRADCSGFVNVAYARAGFDLGLRSSKGLDELAKDLDVSHRRRPHAGDVVFFDDTYDANHNGRNDDPLTHVAVVESVDSDGTVHLIHMGSKGVVRIVMNPDHPDEAVGPDGQPWNSFLRAKAKGDPRSTRYLAGQLWRGYASFWKVSDLKV